MKVLAFVYESMVQHAKAIRSRVVESRWGKDVPRARSYKLDQLLEKIFLLRSLLLLFLSPRAGGSAVHKEEADLFHR